MEKDRNVVVCLLQLAVIPYNFEENKKKIEFFIEKVMNPTQKKEFSSSSHHSSLSALQQLYPQYHQQSTNESNVLPQSSSPTLQQLYPQYNQQQPKELIPDIIVLPEMWNIGYTMKEVDKYCDNEGEETKKFLSALAKKYHVFIIGGSVASRHTVDPTSKNNDDGHSYGCPEKFMNLNMNFDRDGNVLSYYSKVHLFSPAGENLIFSPGHFFYIVNTKIRSGGGCDKNGSNNSNDKENDTKETLEKIQKQEIEAIEELKDTHKTTLEIVDGKDDKAKNNDDDDIYCRFSTAICYDIRFPEFIRSMALEKRTETKRRGSNGIIKVPMNDPSEVRGKGDDGSLDVLFVAAAWPYPRQNHWRQLLIARAIENQCFVIGVNNGGKIGDMQFCGHSMAIDPWGEVIIEGSGYNDYLNEEKEGLPAESNTFKDSIKETNNPNIYRKIIKYSPKQNSGKSDDDDSMETSQKIKEEKEENDTQYDEILVATLSFNELKKIRNKINIFNDRRPESYKCCGYK